MEGMSAGSAGAPALSQASGTVAGLQKLALLPPDMVMYASVTCLGTVPDTVMAT